MSQLSSTKTSQTQSIHLSKAPKFNSLPSFTKSGFIHYQKFQNVRKQDLDQKLTVCELLKAKANNIFLEGDYLTAVSEYEQALSIFRYIFPKNPNTKLQNIRDEDLEFIDNKGSNKEEETKIQEIKVALFNNLAACYLKLKEFDNTIAICGEVISIDPSQAKAWYRRAKAIISKSNAGFQEYSKAKDDLQIAVGLAPQEPTIEELFLKVKEEIVKFEAEKKSSLKENIKETIIEEEKEVKAPEASKGQKQAENNKQNLNKKPEKGNTKQEKEVPKKGAEPEKIPTQATGSNTSTASDDKGKYTGKIEQDNDVWKMLHGDVDPNTQNYTYDLSFEINPNAKVPDEIQEFGRYIENRARELLVMYEKNGKRKETDQLKENLKQAMNTHKRLEAISKLDFSRPGPKLRETATKLNLDLSDPSLKADLVKMQEQNLEDVRKWLKAEKAARPQAFQAIPAETKPEKSRSKKKGSSRTSSETTSTSNTNTTVNNYFINNNYFGGGQGIFSKIFGGNSDSNTKNGDRPQIMPRDGNNSMMKSICIGLIFLFFAYLLFLDQEKQFKKDPESQNHLEV